MKLAESWPLCTLHTGLCFYLIWYQTCRRTRYSMFQWHWPWLLVCSCCAERFLLTNNGGYWLSLGLSPLCSDSSSGSEEEAGPGDDMSGMEHWMSRPSQLGPAHLGSTSSSSSSTQSGGSGNAGRLADSLAHTHISHLAHTHLAHTHLGQAHHQQSHLSQSHHGRTSPISLGRWVWVGAKRQRVSRGFWEGFVLIWLSTTLSRNSRTHF